MPPTPSALPFSCKQMHNNHPTPHISIRSLLIVAQQMFGTGRRKLMNSERMRLFARNADFLEMPPHLIAHAYLMRHQSEFRSNCPVFQHAPSASGFPPKSGYSPKATAIRPPSIGICSQFPRGLRPRPSSGPMCSPCNRPAYRQSTDSSPRNRPWRLVHAA